MNERYNPGYFKKQSSGAYRSAKVIVPMVLDLLNPKSVVDVGCGVGMWLAAFIESGVTDILGIDGPYIKKEMLNIPPGDFRVADLNKPITSDRKFDLAVSLEVAEHLKKESAEIIVNSLIGLAPVVLFSAAMPFQGGNGHVNEQWPEYWVDLFAKHDYFVIDPIRKHVWNNPNVEWWYAQNTLIFADKKELEKYPKLQKEAQLTSLQQLSIVHPKSLTIYTLKNAGPTLIMRALVKKFRKFFK